MERLASRTFLSCLLFLVFTGTKGLQCEDLWFGARCQYQCHCLDNAVCNKTTGDCPGVCDRPWFGPQCQYRDAAYQMERLNLTDGIETTCLVGDDLTHDVPMFHSIKFTWMRFVTDKPGLFDRVNVTFLASSSPGAPLQSSLTTIYVSDTILDIYGEVEGRVQTIRLDFDSVETKQSFCSMQVSSGRNVALKQHASQSSTDSYAGIVGGAEKAVDGKPYQTWGQGSCTFTLVEDISYWTLNLSLPVTVNMYTILGRTELNRICRLNYFRLESYYWSAKVQQYNNTYTQDQSSYEVYPENTSLITSVTISVSKYFWPDDEYSCNGDKTRLSFCEMQLFGDVVCQPGKWGRNCKKNCNCQDPLDSCFVSTGMCPSGCKAGYQGPGCGEECFDGRWGVDCLNSCDNCLDGKCNKSSGECQSKCIPGYKMPHCVENPDELNLAKILVPIVLGIVVVTALVIGICVWRRRKAQHDGGKVVEDVGSRNRPDGVHEPEILPELENQSSTVHDAVDDHYDRVSFTPKERAPDINENEKRSPYAINRHDKNNRYSNVENPPIHEYDRISPYVNEENVPYNEYEKTGENKESHVYTELDDK